MEHVSRFVCRVMQKSNVFLCQTKQTKEYFSHVAWQNAGSQTSIVFAMPDQDPRLLEMRGLPPAAVAAPLFLLYFQAALCKRGWNADLRPHATLRRCSMQSARRAAAFQYSPPRALSGKGLRRRQIYPGDMGSNRRKQEKHAHMIMRARP